MSSFLMVLPFVRLLPSRAAKSFLPRVSDGNGRDVFDHTRRGVAADTVAAWDRKQPGPPEAHRIDPDYSDLNLNHSDQG